MFQYRSQIVNIWKKSEKLEEHDCVVYLTEKYYTFKCLYVCLYADSRSQKWRSISVMSYFKIFLGTALLILMKIEISSKTVQILE